MSKKKKKSNPKEGKEANQFFALSSVRPAQRWRQERRDWEPLKHFLPAHGQNQVSASTD